MLDLEKAALVVEQREQEARDRAIQEEAARQEHNRMMAANSAAMIAGQERARAARAAEHEQARAVARAALDSLKALTAERERCESKVGFSRADLMEAEKAAQRCTEPSPDDYPTESELDAYRQRRGELDEACYRIAARIASEQTALDAALHAEWEGEARFKEAERIELERRNEL